MKTLTKKQQFAYNYFFRHQDRFISPTEIGNKYGDSVGKYYHSSVGSPICLSLVKLGYIERNERGHYKFISLV